jgi:hypothetical protein
VADAHLWMYRFAHTDQMSAATKRIHFGAVRKRKRQKPCGLWRLHHDNLAVQSKIASSSSSSGQLSTCVVYCTFGLASDQLPTFIG